MKQSEPGASDAFQCAVDRLMEQWPSSARSTIVGTARTRTHVIDRPGHGVPLVLLPGGGATAASWAAVVSRIGGRRLLALDIPGDAGKSELVDGKLTDSSEVHEWLDEVLEQLEVDEFDLAGHSFGGWLALSYTIARADRVRRLFLIAPSMCFASLSPRYVTHALPLLVRPSSRAARRLIAWESAGCDPNASSLDVYAAAADRRWGGLLRPTRPSPSDLSGVNTPVDLVLASKDRSHKNVQCERNARKHLSKVTVTTLDGASHHSVLDRGAKRIAELLQ